MTRYKATAMWFGIPRHITSSLSIFFLRQHCIVNSRGGGKGGTTNTQDHLRDHSDPLL